MPTPAELLEQSLTALRAAKRFSHTSNSYRKDNPNEYAKVLAYLDGGVRPSGVTSEMGKHALLEEDVRRQLAEPVPPGLYFNGDFSTGDLSQWNDFHDANLGQSPPGVSVVAKPGGGYMARFRATSKYPSGSTSGDITALWEGNGGDAYNLPWYQNGQSTWFRVEFLLPNGQDANYPGAFDVNASWNFIHEWHTNPGVVPTAYSSFLDVHQHTQGLGQLVLCMIGGAGDGQRTYLYQTDNPSNPGTTDPSARKAAKFNHWYDTLTHVVYGPTAATGSVEWWVDGIQQPGGNCPTIAVASNGSIPGVSHQVQIYRAPKTVVEQTAYFAKVWTGPTRASVGG